MRSSIINLAAVAALAFSGLPSAADATEWKSLSIYQVMVDRYARTDGSTTAECAMHRFCCGTWKGLINQLNYIQSEWLHCRSFFWFSARGPTRHVYMGFTAVHISPIVENIDHHTTVGDAYHGYWSLDNYALNNSFGTEKDFKDLAAELHKRDMPLIVDVVVNNMVQAFDNVVLPKIDYSKFNPFADKKYFHPYCNVTQWENPTDYQNCWLYPYGIALADLKTESPAVVDELSRWVKGLVVNYSIDGLRIDGSKHVNGEFLPVFVEAAGMFAFGEVLSGVTEDMCQYQTLGLLPGMPNYLEYYPPE
ncbi:Alpha-amylase [Madurella mycetomatis]|uniref:Alpha-amylase n=1 Tax=Madurella mycetomatis TaxID=100816 RepID=A0A175W866_9PEZI|nr:Alpha-amylase [Madurella mycetomatis]